MPLCPKCGNEVLESDRFCLNCGQDLGRTTITPNTIAPPPLSGPPHHGKNPWVAAIGNFFAPGLGYVYIGLGRDNRQIVFGTLLFLSLAVTFYVGFISAITSPPATPSASANSADFVGLLYFLLPVAVMYDGYVRAKST